MDAFDEIRPYTDEEVPGVVARLIRDDDFLTFLSRWDSPRLAGLLPGIARRLAGRKLAALLGPVEDVAGFQHAIARYVEKLIDDSTTEFRHEGLEALEPGLACLFVSNHRDIAGDSMLVNYALHSAGRDTVRIAVGATTTKDRTLRLVVYRQGT